MLVEQKALPCISLLILPNLINITEQTAKLLKFEILYITNKHTN